MQKFGFFLVPGYSLIALSSAIDVLRSANVEIQNTEFHWELLGDSGESVESSSGIVLPCTTIDVSNKFDVVAVCGGERSHLFRSRKTENWLKDQARKGALMGSISDGAYVVAKVGLFDNSRSTIHWKCQSAYRELYPDLDVQMSIIEVDGKRFSCAGGTASLDLMLNFVATKLGKDIAGRVADNYFHDVIRGDDQVQHMTSALRFATRNKTLSDALILMESELETPISIAVIARKLNVSHRQLDRIFRSHLHTTPSKHYRGIRLLRATGLLKQTNLPISEIALSCGFQSSSHLTKFFKLKYEMTPYQYRISS